MKKAKPVSASRGTKEVVVSLSGGLDSIVLAYHLKSEGYQVLATHIDFGVHSSQREMDSAKYFATKLRVPLEIINFSGLGSLVRAFGYIGQLDGGDTQDPDPEFGHDADLVSSDEMFVPTGFYNSVAPTTYYARLLGVPNVAFGIIKENVEGRPGVLTFFKAWEAAIPQIDATVGTRARPFSVMLPFSTMSKSAVIELGNKLGVQLDATYSCFKGRPLHCGTCQSCRSRLAAFKALKLEDPAWYEAAPFLAGPSRRKKR